MPNPIKTKAAVSNIINHSEGVYTVQFDIPKRAARFKAGQFLHLTLEQFDPVDGFWPESRVFSIASKPRSEHIEIVYSVKGQYTARMEKELHVGKELWLKLPYGDFIIDKYMEGKDEIVLIAGGTGVSPFIPYLLERLEINKNAHSLIPLTLYYGIRDEQHFLYKDTVTHLDEQAQVIIVKGMFDIDDIAAEVSGKYNCVCFISGPPIMIQEFKRILISHGMPSDNIVIDAWE